MLARPFWVTPSSHHILQRQQRGSRSLSHALHEPTRQLLPVEILADEDHLAPFFLVGLPWLTLRVCEEHMDSLEHEPIFHALHSKDAFRAEEVHALLLEQPADPLLELVIVNLPWHVNTHGAHARVV